MIYCTAEHFCLTGKTGIILLLASLLYACQVGPPIKEYSEEYLVQSGDVPAVRVFEGKTGDGELELSLSSAKNEQGERLLVFCSITNAQYMAESKLQCCYSYNPSTHTTYRSTPGEQRSSFEGIGGMRTSNCKKSRINEPFTKKDESTLFKQTSTLWRGEKQISPLAGRFVIGTELSPDRKTAAILSSDGFILHPNPFDGVGVVVAFALAPFLRPPRDNPRTPEFQHYHQFYDMASGELSKSVRLPLAINAFPMHGCWSPDGKYVVYYGGDDYPVNIKPEEGNKYPDYAAIVHLKERHE